uniref:BTB domain-containing protein n=1 Tax=Panagrolaimus sp. JU765 TaxID=591449 RepID=A0AC34RAY7_9BILA
MALRIVQEAEIIVRECALHPKKIFASAKNQIFLFENCCCSISVIVTCLFKVNSIARGNVHICEGWGYKQFGKKADLFQDGFMKIHADLEFNFEPEMLEILRKEEFHNVASLFDERFKDFVIQVEKKEYKVHRSIIAIASPVFAAMLEPQCKESQEGNVDVKDFDIVTVRAAVDFMYTLNINSPLTTLLNLAKFADKYDLIHREMIFEVLYKKIDLITISEISKFSAANCLEKLYNKCIDFFVKNFVYIVKNIKKFNDLDPGFVMDVVIKKISITLKVILTRKRT